MNTNKFTNWLYFNRQEKLSLDISKIHFEDSDFDDLSQKLSQALDSMDELDKGAIANPDENRMVGHYWLRDTELSPNSEIKNQILECNQKIEEFVSKIHNGEITNSEGKTFLNFVIVGIGGSALGPQLLESSLNPSCAKLKAYFVDNTDPDGIELTLSRIPNLDRTLVLVISKSGGTKETLNGQILTKKYFENKGISVSSCFIAVTGEGSKLYNTAKEENWLEIFPMWIG